MSDELHPGAGWFRDPQRQALMRYWDGRSWTQQTQGPPPSVSPLAIWGVVAGLLLPVAGFVIALILLVRGQVGPGLAAILASCVGLALALAIVAY